MRTSSGMSPNSPDISLTSTTAGGSHELNRPLLDLGARDALLSATEGLSKADVTSQFTLPPEESVSNGKRSLWGRARFMSVRARRELRRALGCMLAVSFSLVILTIL